MKWTARVFLQRKTAVAVGSSYCWDLANRLIIGQGGGEHETLHAILPVDCGSGNLLYRDAVRRGQASHCIQKRNDILLLQRKLQRRGLPPEEFARGFVELLSHRLIEPRGDLQFSLSRLGCSMLRKRCQPVTLRYAVKGL